MYCSSAYIDEFLNRISKAATKITGSFEIILIDDGSPDDSLEIAKRLIQNFDNLKVVELSKNHGHHRAMMIGLNHASGNFVFLTDIDLEESPGNLSIFWETHEKNPEVDVIYGLQPEKDTPFIRKQFSNTFYSFFNSLSSIKISNRELVSRLMNRNFVNNLLKYGEQSIFLPALWTDAGFNQVSIQVSKSFDGISTYSLIKRITLAVDALTSFSAKPLIYVFYSGLSISMLAMLAIFYLLLQKIFIGRPARSGRGPWRRHLRCRTRSSWPWQRSSP